MGLRSGKVIDHNAMRTKRKALGLSMPAAAATAGLSGKQAWNAIETGKKLNVTLQTLYGIAEALKCSPADLLVPAKPRKGGAK